MPSIKGSCLCGAVRFDYDGSFGNITVCHCRDCRKAQGGSVAVVPVDAGRLRWVGGTETIVEYASSPGKLRAFCGRCGSPLYSRREDSPDILRLRMGCIDTPTDAVPVAHIFVNDEPEWAGPNAQAPRYAGQEPGRGTTPAGCSGVGGSVS